ncbi:hypothetical protein AUR63_07605 [Guyparkeria sp. XI15]|nr:hypothetical protein AUR63_07605 [Guyparkeria sp. XI15]OAE88330.1 hypothetical protein AWR35_07620 [Guyparkeria sp. WRN-7]
MADPYVLVLLDTSPASEAALDSAARLARQQQQELIALFVEDQDLIASAGHVFAREISLLSGQARPFDREILLARLARQRQRIETRLASLEQQPPLRWRLDVVTGPVIDNIRQAAIGADWVVLGKAGWSAERGARLGTTARQLVETTRCRLLLWEERTASREAAIVALIGEPQTSGTIIETARLLARASDRGVRALLLPGADPAELPVLSSAPPADCPAMTVERLAGRGLEALRRALRKQPAAALVLDDQAALAFGIPMADLIADLDTPIIRIPASI